MADDEPPRFEFTTYREPKCPRCGKVFVYQAGFDRHWARDHEQTPPKETTDG